ncbi:hypothetical protein EYF80_017555 [Liparis tanakae]|uniref:Uncharacterized protein n=1 Tax=Liparis tanakae TaxID=230148 RepID=A0A4Z2I3C8_9TELE|nr:hypothetical protein EYF80_017555 [Liparis tanakae]
MIHSNVTNHVIKRAACVEPHWINGLYGLKLMEWEFSAFLPTLCTSVRSYAEQFISHTDI